VTFELDFHTTFSFQGQSLDLLVLSLWSVCVRVCVFVCVCLCERVCVCVCVGVLAKKGRKCRTVTIAT